MKEIYKDDYITVSETGHDYDFIAIIQNNSDQIIRFETNGEDLFFLEPYIYLRASWTGLLADNQGRYILRAIKEKKFGVHYGEHSVSYEINLED